MNYKIAFGTYIGNVRTVNQDNFYCLGRYRELEQDNVSFDAEISGRESWIAAVFDGMGGEKDGEIASLIAAKLTCDCEEAHSNIDIGNLITSLNSDICREMSNRKCHMGSTCVFIEFDNSRCRCWNVGDSRAYHYRKGNLQQISEDHTEAASFLEILKCETETRTGSENRLTQHLGIPKDDFIIEPYVSPWGNLEAGDMLLICSDGLTHMVTEKDISGVLGRNISLREKKDLLTNIALHNGGVDNITIILIKAY